MRQRLFAIALLFIGSANFAQSPNHSLSLLPQYIQREAGKAAFKIAAAGKTATICVDPDDWKGVIRAASDLGDDIRKVTGSAASVQTSLKPVAGAIVVGTIGKSRIIDQLIALKKST